MKKQKIGIMTLFFNNNYGATLQAYALQKVLENKGYYAEDIKYYREIDNHPINETGLKSRVRSVKKRLLGFRKQFFQLLRLKKVIAVKKKIKLREKAFQRFILENMNVSSRSYSGHKEISEAAEEYDVFICGSDNIWNKNLLDTAFFLDFVSDEKKKIAYAPGMSTNSLTENEQRIILPLVERFEALSVRERMGQELLAELTTKEVFQALDPSLLICGDEWRKVQKKVELSINRYMFCFFVGDNEIARNCAKKYSEENGLPIINIPHMVGTYVKCDDGFADYELYDIEPSQFIWLINHAEVIFTDSFHGTTFSILMEKKFVCFRRFFDEKTRNLNYRIDSLLEMLGIDNRVIEKIDDFKMEKYKEIDYNKVNLQCEHERQKSLAFLWNALNDKEE